MFGLGTGEILLIAAVVILLFGASRIPQLGEALGKGIRSFRKAADTGVIDVTPEKSASHLEADARGEAGGERAQPAGAKKG